MADRCTLVIHKLDEFKAWLDAQGIEHRPTNAGYQAAMTSTETPPWE